MNTSPYLKEMHWNQIDLVLDKNGIAALMFCYAPIANGKERVR